jgi:chemotaxis protein MotB
MSGNKHGAAPWLLTYSDMVTLLLCFFVMMMAFSTISQEKFYLMMTSIQSAFGILDKGKALDPAEMLGGGSYLELKRFEELAVRLSDYISLHQMEGKVRVSMDEKGLTIRFLDGVLFDVGKADLKEGVRAILDNIAALLIDIPNHICVEGHTDSMPINTEKFPSNWELSTARASMVIRYFIENFDIDPMRLSAAGYGEYRPVASNDTPEGRSLNRRVDIVILRSSQDTNDHTSADNPGTTATTNTTDAEEVSRGRRD